MTWRCAGINHNAWFTELRLARRTSIRGCASGRQVPEIYERDPVRFEVMLHLGYFVTESSGHFSEYVPYFRKRPELVERYTRPGYLGASGFYAKGWPEWQVQAQRRARPGPRARRSFPRAGATSTARTSSRPSPPTGPRSSTATCVNAGLIDNLPQGGCVEVACLVDRRGVQPVHFGPLPEQMAALNRAHMAVHELMAKALLERDRQAALHALMLDPLTAAVCSLAEIEQLFDEMWTAEREYLRPFEGD